MQPQQPQDSGTPPEGTDKQAPSQDKEDVAAEIGLTAIQATGISENPPSEFSGYELTDGAGPAAAPASSDGDVTWEAQEYIHHEKDMQWFIVVGLVAAAFIGLAVWLQAWSFILLIVVMAIALIVFARRKPRVLRYSVTPEGLEIDNKHHAFNEFRAFGVMQESPLSTIVLLPRKRFMPSIDLFFDPQFGEKIVDALGSHLPLQQVKPDFLDSLARKIRF
jgi:hypothetical protein